MATTLVSGPVAISHGGGALGGSRTVETVTTAESAPTLATDGISCEGFASAAFSFAALTGTNYTVVIDLYDGTGWSAFKEHDGTTWTTGALGVATGLSPIPCQGYSRIKARVSAVTGFTTVTRTSTVHDAPASISPASISITTIDEITNVTSVDTVDAVTAITNDVSIKTEGGTPTQGQTSVDNTGGGTTIVTTPATCRWIMLQNNGTSAVKVTIDGSTAPTATVGITLAACAVADDGTGGSWEMSANQKVPQSIAIKGFAAVASIVEYVYGVD